MSWATCVIQSLEKIIRHPVHRVGLDVEHVICLQQFLWTHHCNTQFYIYQAVDFLVKILTHFSIFAWNHTIYLVSIFKVLLSAGLIPSHLVYGGR